MSESAIRLATLFLPLFLVRSLVAVSILFGNPQDVAVTRSETPGFQTRPWNRELMYFVMTDRFFDGDIENNVPEECDPRTYDQNQDNVGLYHGGDLRGLELAIRDGYFSRLGVTTIWITPPVRNVWFSGFDLGGGKAGYHGYWAQDFLDIDPHLVSSRSLDGRPYSNDRSGRMEHYRDFVDLAHRNNIKIVQDVVCNHVGPLFYYDANGNGLFDGTEKSEWIAPFKKTGFHDNARWNDFPAWNLMKPLPAGPLSLLGRKIPTTGIFQDLSVYGRKGYDDGSLGKSDGEEVECDFFSLRDFWTRSDSTHFDSLVDEFVNIYAFYVETVGIDGLRIDTVKHVHHEFWDAFTERLRKRLGDERTSRLLMFGEVYDGNPRTMGRYTFRTDYPANKQPCLDSLLNFQFCFNLRDYLRPKGKSYGPPTGLQTTFLEMSQRDQGAFYNPVPGPDGLRANQKMVNFYENHDGLNRFLVKDADPELNRLALAITILSEGIPCIYYGTETGLKDEQGEIGRDGETGRMTLFRAGTAPAIDFNNKDCNAEWIATLADLRQSCKLLHSGETVPLWVDSDSTSRDDGLFCFARYDSDSRSDLFLVVINASPDQDSETANEDRVMQLVDSSGQSLIGRDTKIELVKSLDARKPAAETGAESPVTPALEWVGETAGIRVVCPPRNARIFRIRSDSDN